MRTFTVYDDNGDPLYEGVVDSVQVTATSYGLDIIEMHGTLTTQPAGFNFSAPIVGPVDLGYSGEETPELLTGKCTCGAEAAGSNFHSSWCDVE
jgi:hypothetical protein